MRAKLLQLHLVLCDPPQTVTLQAPLSVDSPDKNAEVGFLFLLRYCVY